jgi:hypothetical protein
VAERGTRAAAAQGRLFGTTLAMEIRRNGRKRLKKYGYFIT